MKKMLLCLSLLMLSFFAFAVEGLAETVTQMPYTVEMPDVVREGLYTGDVQNGIPNGYGLFTAVNSAGIPWHYIGQWNNGKMCGEGGQYWDSGESRVGLYESNDMLNGEVHTYTYNNFWFDSQPNDHGCWNYKQYRPNGTVMFDGCVYPTTFSYHKGTLYSGDGTALYTGDTSGFEPTLDYSLDLTNVTYEQLVSVKDQLNLAMWNSQEWQEVTVPQGIWKVGEDIPAGHWTISASPTSWVTVTYGNKLEDNQKEVKWSSDYYYSTLLTGEKHVFSNDDDLRSIDIDAKNGCYFEIKDGSVVFTPYSGKPSLGFK